MSYGLTPYEFVQQVFYAQEKVLLDFWPSDDKYKEVLIEANLVLQELQNAEDWTWLRERLVLGSTDDIPGAGQIPEYRLPEWVYKPSMLHDDCVKLCPCAHHHHHCHGDVDGDFLEHGYIEVPYMSTGRLNGRSGKQRFAMATNVPNFDLGAVVVGDTLTFNRPLTHWEKGRIAVADMQRRIPLMHVCTSACKGIDPDKKIDYSRDDDGNWKNPCAKIEDRVFQMIPDPNYVVFRTAALHAEGSPPAQGRIATLTDTAQKILSAMRQNDTSATDPDYIDWEPVGFVNGV